MMHHFTEERLEALADASPERAVVVFYDQAIDKLHEAIRAIARKAIAERCNAITGAIDILSEMVICMDLDQDDEIGANIERIHRFIIANLPKVNLYDDAKFAAEAVRLLRELRDAFAMVERNSEALRQLRLMPSGGRPHLSLVSPVA